MNKRGEKPEKLNVEGLEKQKERTEFVDLVGQDSVTRFDKAKKKKKKGTPSQQRGNRQPGQRENNGGNRPPRNDRSSRGDMLFELRFVASIRATGCCTDSCCYGVRLL